MKIPNGSGDFDEGVVSLARIVSEDSQHLWMVWLLLLKSSKDS